MGADGTPTTKDVTVGLVTSTTAEIKSGLAEGDTVITGTASDRVATSGNNGNGNNRGFGGGGVTVNGGGPVFTRP
jgi:macrolide-specific efflux system membrane fusion protein